MDWQREIEELHDVFQAYFAGQLDTLERVELVLGEDFTIVAPGGGDADRAATLAGLAAGHGRAPDLEISTTNHRLLFEHDQLLAARYVEVHASPQAQTHRLSTVVFTKDPAAPNGLLWRTVHETWLSH